MSGLTNVSDLHLILADVLGHHQYEDICLCDGCIQHLSANADSIANMTIKPAAYQFTFAED